MQPNNQHKNQYHDNAFAEVVNHDEEEDQIGNIFNQGNLHLRNEESEFVPEDVGSLRENNFKSQSNSDDESNNGEKSLHQYTQVTPHRQNVIHQATRYGELIMASPDIHQRHSTFMPVYTQEDEVEDVVIAEQHIGNGRHLSGRHSGVSEEDFYISSQYSQPNRLFPHDMSINHYGFAQINQHSQQDMHHLNYQQQQSAFLQRGRFSHDQYYYKSQDKPQTNVAYQQDQEKQVLEASQKQNIVPDQEVVHAECSCDSFKEQVFAKIKLPSDDSECMDVSNNQQDAYQEENQELSETKLLKSSADIEQSAQVGNKSQVFVKMRESENCRVHSLNVNESSQTVDLKEQQKETKSKELNNKQGISYALDQDELNRLKDEQIDSKVTFTIAKGKRKTARERKYFEKRRKLIEQVLPAIKEIGALEWDNFIERLKKSENQLNDKLNPITQFNTSTFWYYLSALYFPKCHEGFLEERLCHLSNVIRGDESSRYWEKNFRDHPTFIRKSWRLFSKTLQRIDRSFMKTKESKNNSQISAKKLKDSKRKSNQAFENPTQVEDLINQLQADKEDCATEVNYMLYDLLETIKSQKRPRLNQITEENQVRLLLLKNNSCQQAVAFNQELNNFSTQNTIDYLDLEQQRYNKIKAQKLKQLREQYEKARVEDNKDYIITESVGKSFLGMLKHSYETCFICSEDDYDENNQRVQCSVCEYFVHQECLGESINNLKTENYCINQDEAQWTCQSCQVDQSLKKKFSGIDVSFKPQCVYCGLTGGIMRATTNVCNDIKKTPGCNIASAWSASSTNGIAIANLTKKEKEYQIKLTEAKIKLWKDENEGKTFPIAIRFDENEMKDDAESLQILPDKSPYTSSFVHWAHMSCAQWLLLKNFSKKKPISMRQVPQQSHSEDGEKCEICGGSNGVLQTCTFSKKKQGEDQVLEELYKQCVSDQKIEVSKDAVMRELLDEQIEGGLCDYITNASVNQKNNKGYLVEICDCKMHVECARRAEYYMKFDPEIETLEFYCSKHTPLPLKTELKQSLDEQITNITEFAENYQNILKESIQYTGWTELEQTELLKKVATTFFQSQKLRINIERSIIEGDEQFKVTSEQNQVSSISEPFLGFNHKDWKVTLSYSKFAWRQISVGDHDSVDCWKKYWEIIGFSESRFRSQILSLSKTNQIKCTKLLKLKSITSKMKIKEDLKFEEILVGERVQDSAALDQKEHQAFIMKDVILKSKDQQVKKIKKQKKNLILKVESSQDDQKVAIQTICSLRQTPERMKTKVIQESRLSLKRQKKIQVKKRELIQKELAKIKSCYCKCPLSSMFENKNLKKNQQKNELSLLEKHLSKEKYFENQKFQLPDFYEKIQEESYKICFKAPKNISSKSGITRCQGKKECPLGAYFHDECCQNAELSFGMNKKTRGKWFCLQCRERVGKEDSSNLLKESENIIEPNHNILQPLSKEADKTNVCQEILVNDETKLAQVSEAMESITGPVNDKKASKIIKNKKRPEISLKIENPVSKRQKINDKKTQILCEKIFDPSLIKIEETQPIQYSESIVSIDDIMTKLQTSLVEHKQNIEVATQNLKKTKRVKAITTFQTAPLIADLIKKVENTLPLSQKQQNVFIELKKAIEAHTNFLKEENEKKEVELKYQVDEKVKDMQQNIELKTQASNETQQQLFGQIEIKIDPVVKPNKVLGQKKQAVQQVIAQQLEQQKPQQTVAIQPQSEPATSTATKLSLSQQFLINLQRNQQPIKIKKDSNINMLSLNAEENSNCNSIQLQIEAVKQKPNIAAGKLKTKKTNDSVQKSVIKFDQTKEIIQNQPVTIVYYNNQSKLTVQQPQNANQQNTQNSQQQSPPIHLQNPLEPKLAAGPASGYPQQAFNINSNYQNGHNVTNLQQNFFNQTEIQQIEQNIQENFIIDDTVMQQETPLQTNLTEIQLAEIQRKLDKKERKRLRKVERSRRETENNIIQIDTQYAYYPPEQLNPSLISICTNPQQTDQQNLNLVQLQTLINTPNTQIPATFEKPKKKKSKKPTQQAQDIDIDTGLQKSMISIEPSHNMTFPIPIVQQRNQINIQNTQNFVEPSEVQIQTQLQASMFNQMLLYPQSMQSMLQMQRCQNPNDHFDYGKQQQAQVQFSEFIPQMPMQEPAQIQEADEFIITIPFDYTPKQSKGLKENYDVTILQMEVPQKKTSIDQEVKKKKKSKKLL